MAWPTDQGATGELISAAQFNRLPALLSDTLVTSAGTTLIDITSIPAHWSNLLLVCYLRGSSGTAPPVLCRFNGDTGNNYDWQNLQANGATVGASESLATSSILLASAPGASDGANLFNAVEAVIPHYANSANHKTVAANVAHKLGTASGNVYAQRTTGAWRSTAAITRITLSLGEGDFAIGSRVSLYGMGRI